MTGHNIAVYDTGRINSYTRRNEGFAFGSGMAVLFAQIFAMPLLIFGVDEGVLAGVIGGGFVEFLLVLNILLFVTHRNFMLTEAGTDANDAIYLLPKEERKRWKTSKAELNALTQREANQLVEAVKEFRSHNPSAGGSVHRLTQALNDINYEYKMIEGK